MPSSLPLALGGGGHTLGFVAIRNGILGLSMLSALIASLCFLPQRAGKILLGLLCLLSIPCFIIDLFCFLNFKIPLTSDMLFTAFETTWRESQSFLEMYLGWSEIFWISVFLGLSVLFWKFFAPKSKKAFIAFIIFSLFGCVNWAVEIRSVFAPNYYYFSRASLDFIEPLKFALKSVFVLNAKEGMKQEFAKQQEMMKSQKIKTSLTQNPIENIVLILGESAQRGHMQLYGYSKATNPYMMELQKSPNLLVFDDVISPHAQTNASISKIFTMADYENQAQKPWYAQNNLFSFLKSAGYFTFWISNQESPLSASPASVLGNINEKYHLVSSFKQLYDEEVLPPLENYLKSPHKLNFITIHLSGSHASYVDHYPQREQMFSLPLYDEKKRKIVAYDNTILYNDYVLNEIFKRFSGSDSIVIYLSDHGEEIYERGEFAGHIDTLANRFMVEIPMLIYVSDIFIQKHPKIYEKLKASVHRPYMSDDLIHTVLDIAGIQTPNFDPTRSIINDQFNEKRRRIVGGSNGKDYDIQLKGQEAKYR